MGGGGGGGEERKEVGLERWGYLTSEVRFNRN